jgi:antitoxin HigA-1
MIDGAVDVHHGDIIRREYMEPAGLSAADLASALGIAVEDMRAVIDGRDDISHDLARRLANYFHTSIGLWLNLQAGHYREVITGII